MSTLIPPRRPKVLITGGSGFIGSYVADEFLGQCWDVVILNRSGAESVTNRAGLVFVRGRVGDRAVLEEAFGYGIDGVVHLACSSAPSSIDAGLDVQANLVESLLLLEYCRVHKVQKVVVASSGGTVYGVPKTLPILEEDTTAPICSYGIVKLALEKYCDLYSRSHALNYVALRIANPYGPGQSPHRSQGVVSVFAAKMLQGRAISLWGDGNAVRDFVHVRDLARLFFLAMTSSANGVYNAGSGVGISISYLIRTISRELRVDPDITYLPGRPCDVPVSVLGCRKARETFGWQPEITLERGIQEVASWLRRDLLIAPPAHMLIKGQVATIRSFEGVA